MLLTIGIDNAISQLQRVLPGYSSGQLDEPHHPHAIAVLYRKLGVCRMLDQGVVEPLFVAQMQSASAYLTRLPRLSDHDKVTSRSAVFFDAIGGEYWDAAAKIAAGSRPTVNPTWEHEDDFLYVWFLMTRYFLDGLEGDEDEAAKAAWEQRQRDLLERWEVVLEGGLDPRLPLCDALLRRDEGDFGVAFEEVAGARDQRVRKQIERGEVREDDAVWVLPWWGEGLALLRLAERDGLRTDEHCPMVPQISRGPNPFAYDPMAWGRIDFRPARKTT
ncbi:hypothetical protein [Paraliomyxa miuraensis]|uniref:hypothetical protein n=1 Tax=Paraliomyxa miuraensis TaxID=376150 RepID=UPI00225092B9|nr:hypothetical protein [Paraliomyxa miuraensis]MCX4242253.1 immunity 49 family protein [Paraliomyxa miuraensis]